MGRHRVLSNDTLKNASGFAFEGRISVTVKVDKKTYARIRQFAFDKRTTHQDVLEAALMRYLDGEGA